LHHAKRQAFTVDLETNFFPLYYYLNYGRDYGATGTQGITRSREVREEKEKSAGWACSEDRLQGRITICLC
jgi:hypothetical protein